ncbi:MAG: hypothetical protein GY870_00780 [archaeon]|nr:hypothetical protein [archaeon]
MVSKSSSGKGLAILALIISILGMGLGVYSIQFDSGSGYVVVGLWESLYRDMDNPDFNTNINWLMEVADTEIYNTDYIILNESAQYNHTRFNLVKNGWYRVNIIMILYDTSSIAGFYYLDVLKNGIPFLSPVFEVSINQYLPISVDFYISSDGNDYYEFNFHHLTDSFYIYSQQINNQLAIDYLGEY